MATYPGDVTAPKRDQDPTTCCYERLVEVLEEYLPQITPGDERDALMRMHRHLRCAGSMPPLRLLR